MAHGHMAPAQDDAVAPKVLSKDFMKQVEVNKSNPIQIGTQEGNILTSQAGRRSGYSGPARQSAEAGWSPAGCSEASVSCQQPGPQC